MQSPFPPINSCALILLQELYDATGKHMEYRYMEGTLFARMTKVKKHGGFIGLFDVFLPAGDVNAELRDAQNNLLLTTVSHYGSTKRECRVDILSPAGVLLGYLYDASYGVDFTLPDDTVIGRARRPDDRPTEPKEVAYTYTDAAGRIVGTCERTYPDQSHSLFDFLMNDGVNTTGMPLQTISIEANAASDMDPLLRTFLFLFPALQNLRYARSE